MIQNRLIRKSFHLPSLMGSWLAPIGLLLLLVVSCSTEDVIDYEPEEQGIPIRFQIGWSAETRVSTDAQFTSTWEDGDKIGVFIVKGNVALQASGNYVDNLELTYNEATNTWTHPALPDDRKYFPTDGDRLSFYAYHPYRAGINPLSADFSIKQDQRDNGYDESEVLIAKTLNYRETMEVPLYFSHVYAMLHIEVVGEGNVPPLSDMSLTIVSDIQSKININLESSDVTTTGSFIHDINMHKVEGLESTYRVLLPPQSAITTSVRFQQAGIDFLRHYQVDYTQGYVHKYKITIRRY